VGGVLLDWLKNNYALCEIVELYFFMRYDTRPSEVNREGRHRSTPLGGLRRPR